MSLLMLHDTSRHARPRMHSIKHEKRQAYVGLLREVVKAGVFLGPRVSYIPLRAGYRSIIRVHVVFRGYMITTSR